MPVNLPTTRWPVSVRSLIICILVLFELALEAMAASTLFHTLSTEPVNTWYALVRKPISHFNPAKHIAYTILHNI